MVYDRDKLKVYKRLSNLQMHTHGLGVGEPQGLHSHQQPYTPASKHVGAGGKGSGSVSPGAACIPVSEHL